MEEPKHKRNPHYNIPSTASVTSSMASGSTYNSNDSPSTSHKNRRHKVDPNADPNLREAYGLNLGLLRKWELENKDQLLGSEHAKQEIAVAKVRGFLDAVGEYI